MIALHEPTPPAFPVDALAPAVQRFCHEGAKAFSCPIDYFAAPALVVSAVALGPRAVIQPKPGWEEGARLWIGLVGDPGTKKSPALGEALRPQRELQRSHAMRYAAERSAYERGLLAQRAEEQAWSQQARQAVLGKADAPGSPPDPLEVPRFKTVLTTDATVEALAPVLADADGEGVLLACDELASLPRSMNQYKGGSKGSDRQAYLALHNGAQIVIVRKALPEPLMIENPFLCICGCVPPEVLSEFRGPHGQQDGFTERFLWAYPDAVPVRWTDDVLSAEARNGYCNHIALLRGLAPAAEFAGDDQRFVATLAAEGKTAMVRWLDQHHAMLQLQPRHRRGFLAKLDATLMRMILIVHASYLVSGLVRTQEVERESVVAAIRIVEYFRDHSIRVLDELSPDPDELRLQNVLAWIASRGGRVRLREMQQHNVAGVRTRAEAEGLLRKLEARGAGELAPGTHGSLFFSLTEPYTRQTENSVTANSDLSGVGPRDVSVVARPLPGDRPYLVLLDEAVDGGHLTDKERHDLRCLHFLIRRVTPPPADEAAAGNEIAKLLGEGVLGDVVAEDREE